MSVANRRKLGINQIHRTPRITLRSVDKGVRGWRCNSLDPKRPWRFSLLAGLMVISFGNFVAENRQNPLSSIKRDPGKLLPLPSLLYNFLSRLWNLVAFRILMPDKMYRLLYRNRFYIIDRAWNVISDFYRERKYQKYLRYSMMI